MTKLYSFTIGNHRVFTEDKIFADFMNGKKKPKKKKFDLGKLINIIVSRLLP